MRSTDCRSSLCILLVMCVCGRPGVVGGGVGGCGCWCGLPQLLILARMARSLLFSLNIFHINSARGAILSADLERMLPIPR